MKTIDEIKKVRKVTDSLKQQVKDFGKINREILNALKEKPKTIPQISEEIKIESNVVTYHLMTLRKYGKIEAGEPDDMDEYFYYNLTK